MSKIGKISNSACLDKDEYIFFCPGCKCGHHFWVSNANYKNPEKLWGFNGDLDNPTVIGSILVMPHKGTPGVFKDTIRCHSIITNGMISFCGDSEHEFKDKTVSLGDLNE